MKCPKCEMNINDNSKFCIHCGYQFNNEQNSKYCISCGSEIIPGSKFCGVCGAGFGTNVSVPAKTDVNDDNKNPTANLLGILSLVLYFCGPVLVGFLYKILPYGYASSSSSVASLSSLAGIVIMIVGRIKYPKNTLLKVAMWIIIILILLGIVAFVLIFLWCWITCSTYDTSGCG